MIRFLEYNQIDKAKWNSCIDNSVNKLVYAYSWYLDIVCEKWDAIVEDDYTSVFPINIGSKYGISYLFQPPFTQQLGLFSVKNIDYKLIRDFLIVISGNFKFIEINLNYKNNSFSKIFNTKHSTFNIQYNSNYELRTLGSEYDSIQNLFSLNHKRNIKKAKLSDSLEFGVPDIKDVIALFRSNRGKDIKNLTDKHYDVLINLIKTLQNKDICKIQGAYTKVHSEFRIQNSELKNLCAAIVFIETEDRHILLFSGSDALAKKNGAMYLLIDNHIRQNTDKNIILDFEGSNDKNLARFYNGFGAAQNKYLSVKQNTLPLHIKTALKFVKWIKSKNHKS